MKKLLITFLFALITFTSFSQTYLTKDTTFGGWNARVSYISGFSDSTEVIVNINGLGEVGTDPAKALVYGPHYWINNGWNGQITLGNGIHYPVYVTLQQPAGYQQPQTVKPKLDLIWARFKAKKNARYGMGMSNGGWVWHNLIYYEPTLHDHSYFNYMTAIVSLQGQRADDNYGADPYSYPNYFGHGAKNGTFKFLAVEQVNDGRDLSTIIKRMIDSVGSNSRFAFFWTNWGASGHTNFNDMYNPAENNWTLSNPEIQLSNGGAMNTLPIAGDQNLYQWLLRQGDTTMYSGGADTLMEVNAGSNKVLYLPLSFVELGGTATHAGHTITGYSWTKISGPDSSTFLIHKVKNIATNLTDTLWVNNLAYGTYTFRLTATNEIGGTGYDDVVVNVNATYVCNEAAPVTYTITETQPGQIYYVDGSGMPWKGGDTLEIAAGNYSVIQFGNVGGDPCRPLFIRPLGNITTSQLRFNNYSHHITYDGKTKEGVRSTFMTSLASNLSSDITIKNLNIGPNPGGVGVYYKQDPDSTKPKTWYQSYVIKKITLDSFYVNNVSGEGFYVGNTAPNADPYYGYITPIRMDSITLSNHIVDSTGWDGIQLSAARNGNKIFGNVVTNFGLTGISGQKAGIILGGTSTGDIYNNTVKNGTGNGIQVFGYGTVNMYNNYVDSVGSIGNEQSFYGLAGVNLIETDPKLQLNIYNNTIRNPKSQGAMDFRRSNTGPDNLLVANVYNNTFCIPGATESWQTTYLKFDNGWTGSNNVLNCDIVPPVINLPYFKGLFRY